MPKAYDLMNSNVTTLDKKKGYKGVVDIFVKTKTDYIIVTDDNKPIGIVTERDVLKKILTSPKKAKLKIDSVMSKDLIYVSPETGLREISTIMTQDGIRHLPVIANGNLVGLINNHDLARETKKIQGMNIRFTKYQNFQSFVIILCLLFIIFYFIFRIYFM